jgi:SMODS and SLOG-associating 2TM effector domain 3
MDRFHPGERTAVSRRHRSFSRLAIGVAGAIMAAALALIRAAVNRLDLFETLGAETFAVAAGFALFCSSHRNRRLQDPSHRVGKSGVSFGTL